MAVGTVFVTGASSGIGSSVADLLLTRGFKVFGISRRKPLNKGIHHIRVDLSNLNEVESFDFSRYEGEAPRWLINNAGILGQIGKLYKNTADGIVQIINVNLTAPYILTTKFIQTYLNTPGFLGVIFIGSGAAFRVIEGLGGYCITKAGLKMLAETLHIEMKKFENIRFFYVLPGIVETPMQARIRQAKEEDLPEVNYFIQHYKEGRNRTPTEVAHKIMEIIEMPHRFHDYLVEL